MKLNDRQIAFLVAMQDGHERGSGWIFHDAFPDAPHRGRRDAGATRTLDGMEKLGLVDGRYPTFDGGRNWRITTAGRAELHERGLLVEPKKIGLAQRINGVPDRLGYIYGMAVREGETVTAPVMRLEGHVQTKVGEASGVGWAGPDGLHAAAQRLVDSQVEHG